MGPSKNDSTGETKIAEIDGLSAQENSTGNTIEMSSNDTLLDQIQVPPLASDERIVSAVSCNGGITYTTVAPSELGAVPEEDEEAATSSTPSTVVSFCFRILLCMEEEESGISDFFFPERNFFQIISLFERKICEILLII